MSDLNQEHRIFKRSSGFTLVEILIVIAIISSVLALSIPAIERITLQRISSTARKFVGITRTVRNDAVLLNNIYRLGVDLQKNTYWIESQRELKAIQDPSQGKNSNPGGANNFLFADKYCKEPIQMPNGTRILGVLKQGEGLIQADPKSNAPIYAYVHFFPNGYNEPAIVYFAKEGKTDPAYSLRIPATGRAELFSGTLQSFDEVKPQ